MVKEKELTRAREALAQARRAMPWERVEKRYVFDGPRGAETLEDLFAGRSQLLVYHFMFAPEWDKGCKSCCLGGQLRAVGRAPRHRDVTMVAISRAPLEKLEAYKKSLGWTFPWVSSGRCDFNYDYNVSFERGRADATYNYVPKTYGDTDLPGISVFVRAAGGVFHTYSTFSRGIDAMNATYQLLESRPEGPRRGRLQVRDGMAPPQQRVRRCLSEPRGDGLPP